MPANINCQEHSEPVPGWRTKEYLQKMLLVVDSLKEQPTTTIAVIAEFGAGDVKQCSGDNDCEEEIFVSRTHELFIKPYARLYRI